MMKMVLALLLSIAATALIAAPAHAQKKPTCRDMCTSTCNARVKAGTSVGFSVCYRECTAHFERSQLQQMHEVARTAP